MATEKNTGQEDLIVRTDDKSEEFEADDLESVDDEEFFIGRQESTTTGKNNEAEDTAEKETTRVKRRVPPKGRKSLGGQESTESLLRQLVTLMQSNQRDNVNSGKRERIQENEEELPEGKQKKVSWSSILRTVNPELLPQEIDAARRLDEKPKNVSASLSFLAVPCVGRESIQLFSPGEMKEFEDIAQALKHSNGTLSVLAQIPFTPLRSTPLQEEFQDLQLYVRCLESILTLYDDAIPPIPLYILLGVISKMVKKVKYLYNRDKDGKIARVIYDTNGDYEDIETRSKAASVMATTGRWNGGFSSFSNSQRGNKVGSSRVPSQSKQSVFRSSKPNAQSNGYSNKRPF